MTSTATDRRAWPGPVAFSLLFWALLATFHSTILIGMDTLHLRDFAAFAHPLAYHHRECFWQGEIPLWNPLNACGMPYLAQWNTLVLYPGSLIYLLLPLPWSLNLFGFAHLYLGALGMYFLVAQWTNNRRAGALAGLAFGFSGLLQVALMWQHNIAALAWMPWVVRWFAPATRREERAFFKAIFVSAMQMLCGSPETILLTWIIAGATWLAEGWENRTPIRTLITAQAPRALLLIVTVTGLCAAQLLPFGDLLSESSRKAGVDNGGWSMPPQGAVNLVLPTWQCQPSARGAYVQPGQFWTASIYTTPAIACLALLGLILYPKPRILIAFLLAILGLWLAMGPPGGLYAWGTALFPPLTIMRFPVKFIMLTIFALPLLAGCAWARLEEIADADPARARRTIMVAGAAWIGLLAALLGIAWSRPAFPAAIHDQTWDGGVRIVFLAICLAAMAIGWNSARTIAQARSSLLLVLVILGFDLLVHGRPLTPALRATALSPHLLASENHSSISAPSQGRFFQTKALYDLLNFNSVKDPEMGYFGMRAGLLGDTSLLEGIATVHGFYSLYLPHHYDFWANLFFAPSNSIPAGALDCAGAAFIPAETNLLEWQRRATALPLITAGQQAVCTNDLAALQLVMAPGFDARRTLYLPTAAAITLHAVAQTNVAITLREQAAHRCAFTVGASQPAIVFISQTHSPHWLAQVDGQPVPLWRANYAFQALAIPAGRHDVALRYVDRSFQAGVAISLFSLGLTCASWAWRRRRNQVQPRSGL